MSKGTSMKKEQKKPKKKRWARSAARATSAWQKPQPVETRQVGESTESLLSRGSQVQILPGAPIFLGPRKSATSPSSAGRQSPSEAVILRVAARVAHRSRGTPRGETSRRLPPWTPRALARTLTPTRECDGSTSRRLGWPRPRRRPGVSDGRRRGPRPCCH